MPRRLFLKGFWDRELWHWLMKNIKIIGVHHRHQMSIAEVEDAIAEFKPHIVAVELPRDDYLKFLEVRSYLETEMKIAMVTGCEFGAEIFLIDMEKEAVERKLRKVLKIEDRKLWDEFDKGDVPAFYRRLLEISPSSIDAAKGVLLREREAVMAFNILALAEKFPESRILAVVGYSHKEAIEELLENKKGLQTVIEERGIDVDEPFFLECEEIMIYG